MKLEIEKLRIEREELIKKIGKLEAFTNSNKFKGLEFIDKVLLNKQKNSMIEYSGILTKRINRMLDQI